MFNEFITLIQATHERKAKDYGASHDPLANVRASQEWGIEPWVGAMVRLNDKVKRLQTLARTGKLANESAIDSFIDIAVYAGIAFTLYTERNVDDWKTTVAHDSHKLGMCCDTPPGQRISCD